MEHSTVDNWYPTRCACMLVGDSFNRRHTVYMGLSKLLSLSTYMNVVMKTG